MAATPVKTEAPIPSRRRRALIAGAILAVVVAVVGLVWFQPQKLFIDETVDEAPLVQPRDATDDDGEMASATRPPADLSGTFSSLAHETTGQAIVRTTEDGSRFLRLEGFETSNGPDVRVYLSAGSKDAYGKDFVDLGGLKGNKGNQNYVIPDGTDLGTYDTAVIWCRRFTVAFGAAQLG